MAFSFERFVALRYLQSKRKEVFISIITVISVLGVAVSVMVLNIVLSVMTGFEKELQSKLLDTAAHVVVRQYGSEFTTWKEAIEKIKAVPEVVSVSPYTYSQAMLSTRSTSHGMLVRGIANDEANRSKIAHQLDRPESFDKLFTTTPVEVERPDGSVDTVELPPIILGRALRNRLGLAPGQAVTLLAPQFSAAPSGLVPRMRRFGVVASYSSGLMEYESGLAYTSIEAAQQFFALGDSVSGLEVMLRDLNVAPEVAAKIKAALGGELAPFEVTDWTIPNKPLWDALKLEKRVYFIVLLLLILVASFSIVSTLVMLVMEKTKDIAVLKAMGLADARVLKLFLLQGSIIGAAGTALGTLLGWLGCLGLKKYGFSLDESVFSLSEVPVHLVPSNFVAVAAAALVITTLAGVYPARRAAKLRPADSLRFE